MNKIVPDSNKRMADAKFKFTKNAQMIRNGKCVRQFTKILDAIEECLTIDDLMFLDIISIQATADEEKFSSLIQNFATISTTLVLNKMQVTEIENKYKEVEVVIPAEVPKDKHEEFVRFREQAVDQEKNAALAAIRQDSTETLDRMLDIVLFAFGYYDKEKRADYPELKQTVVDKYFGSNSSLQDIIKSFKKLLSDVNYTIYN